MAVTSQCPDPQRLQRLLLGRLPEEAVAGLERHIEHCDRCRRLIPTLAAEDSLVDAMRARPAVSLQPSDRTTIQRLLPRLHGLRGPTAAPERSQSGLTGNANGKGSAESAMSSFLAPPQAPDEIGRLGPYRVLKLLGRGGMGVVFLAEGPQLQRTVALKAMLPEIAKKAAAKERFLREARATAKIEHDHIVTIYQVGEDRGVPFLTMQLLRGLTLEDFLRKKQADRPGLPFTLDQILKLGREIAKGLAAAHERGLVHRDIKPANIWLDATAGGRVKILDFGLVRADEQESRLTQVGTIVGTVSYMAPEQARGGKIDARADLFSLGCVLYRLCTGRLPFQGGNAMETLVAAASEEPVPVQQANPDLPPKLARLVMKLLAKKPEDRPASAKAVVEVIQGIEQEQPTVQMKALLPVAKALAVPTASVWQGATQTNGVLVRRPAATEICPRRRSSRGPGILERRRGLLQVAEREIAPDLPLADRRGMGVLLPGRHTDDLFFRQRRPVAGAACVV